MLCRKFDLKPTNIFQVMSMLKNKPNFGKKAKAIAHGIFKKMAPKSPPIFIIFSDTY